MRRKIFIAAGILSLAHTLAGATQTKHPSVYIDRGICPGEGCSFEGQVKVRKPIMVYSSPRVQSRRLFEILPGQIVISLDSQVQTIAGRFVVKRSYERYRSGDVLWVYTYLGEGVFKIWHGGRMYEENVGFSPWGGTAGKRCEMDERICWGELDRELEMTWWLKIKSGSGRKGWIRVDDNLEWLDDQARLS